VVIDASGAAPPNRAPFATLGVVPRALLLFLAIPLFAQTGENVLLVVNSNSAVSRQIGDYYRPRRSVPVGNICYLKTTTNEEIDWPTYLAGI